jgi:hypothetical protein
MLRLLGSEGSDAMIEVANTELEIANPFERTTLEGPKFCVLVEHRFSAFD